MIQPLAKSPAPKMVQIAPNRFVQMDLPFADGSRPGVPELVLCEPVPVPGHPGHFELKPRTWEHLVRVDEALCRKLGLGGETWTQRRLIRSGFVDGGRPSPKIYTVNLASYFQHLKRCAEDPDFWENPGVLEQYKENNSF